MKSTITRGAAHNFQAPENWNEETDGKCSDLQVRAETMGEREIVELFSTWKPTEYELRQLNAGGVIEIGICSVTQPAMQVGVVDPVEPALLPYVPPVTTINEAAHVDDYNGTHAYPDEN
jgi:hypothetical protein